MNTITDICDWNAIRGNTEYYPVLEGGMLDEELDEFLDAYNNNDIVEQADALADIIFVAVGALYKLTGADETKVLDILHAVTEANNLKPKDRVDGKIIKGADYKEPQPKIAEILGCK
jgi:predicted HAD superfamily Cof-like phosphohydrolase